MKPVYYLIGIVVVIAMVVYFQNNQTNPTGMAAGDSEEEHTITASLEGTAFCDDPNTYANCGTLAQSEHYDREAAIRRCIITAKAECYASYAIEVDDFHICELPSIELDFAELGEMTASCYSDVAVAVQDRTICENIDKVSPAANREYEYCTLYSTPRGS